jgi:DNA-binding NarL/FixJ family response regulator
MFTPDSPQTESGPKRAKPRHRGHKVVIVDDHPMIREHLGYLLMKQLGAVVCGEASNSREGMEVIVNTEPDVAIVDLKLPGVCGLELVKEVTARRLKTRVLVLSMHDEELYAERAFKAGANGYITKENVSSEVVSAIEQVMDGRIYASEAVAARLFDRVGRLARTELDLLTDRELEVFLHLGHGKNTREIASELMLGPSTVDTYRSRIKTKLGLRSSAELYQRAGLWVRENGG